MSVSWFTPRRPLSQCLPTRRLAVEDRSLVVRTTGVLRGSSETTGRPGEGGGEEEEAAVVAAGGLAGGSDCHRETRKRLTLDLN